MIRWRATLLLVLGLLAAGVSNAAVPTSTKLTLELTPAGIDTRWPTNAAWILATTGLQFATIPDCVVANGATGSCNIRAPYLTDVVGGATLAANCSSALPTGGFSLTTNGVDYASTTTTDITCTFTAMRSPFVAISNSVRFTSTGAAVSDALSPPKPIELTTTAGAGTVTLSVDTPADNHDGTNAGGGTDTITFLANGSPIGTVAVSPPAVTGALAYSTIGTVNGSNSAVQSGNDWTLTCAGTGHETTTDGECVALIPVTGAACASVTVDSITNAATYNKGGLEIRSTADPGSVSYSPVVMRLGSAYYFNMRSRSVTGGSRATSLPSITLSSLPATIRVCKDASSNLVLSHSADGNSFSTDTTLATTLPATAYIGITATSTTAAATPTVVGLSNLSITQAGKATYQHNTLVSATYTATATDVDNNTSAATSGVVGTPTVPADTTAPVISVQPTGSANGSSNSINWGSGTWTDAGTIRGYTWALYAGSTCAGSPTSTGEQISGTYSQTGLTANTAYSIKTTATDTAGNVSASSNCATATTAASATDPVAAPVISSCGPATANPTTQITCTWAAATNADHYLGRHCYGSGCTSNFYVVPDNINGLSYTFNGNGTTSFSPNSTYGFQIASANASNSVAIWSGTTDGTTSDVASGTAINWHPGHYAGLPYFQYSSNTSTARSANLARITEICSISQWKGVHLYLSWGGYEGSTEGDYAVGRESIRQYLAALNTCGKYLNITITAFNPSSNQVSFLLPAYLGTGCTVVSNLWSCPGATYGLTTGSSGGRTLGYSRFWNAATMDRFIAMTQDIGTQFGNDAALESVGFWELLAGGVANGTDGYSESGMATQAIRWVAAARAALPKQQVRLGVNYWSTDAGIVPLLQACAQYSCSWGGPEVLALGSIQANQVYRGYLRNGSGTWVQSGTDYSTIIPYVGQTEWKENSTTATPANLFSRNNADYSAPSWVAVKMSYFNWQDGSWNAATYPFKDWETSVRPFVESTSPTHPIEFTTCPTSFPSCKTN